MLIMGLLVWVNLIHAQINRPYEPMVIKGDTLSAFSSHEMKYLYLFAFQANDSSWRMIPFQIDEVNPKVKDSLKYFIPEDSLRGFLDSDDELTFILGDLGDKADSTKWLTGADSIRYEISFFDSLNKQKGYVYLYFSKSITQPIPKTYAMAYDSVKDKVMSANYELGFNQTGQVGDVKINSKIGGSGIDIFDRLKIRLLGSWWFLPIVLYEDNVHMGYAYAKAGPVRVIRNMFGRFYYELGGGVTFDEKFTQTSFFYPWNGTFSLVKIPLEDAVEYGVEVDVVRVSWDFNRHAAGMKFYTEKNKSGLLIDGKGKRDNIDPTCVPDQLNWTMGSGNQGTLLNVFYIPPLGESIRIYYYDHFSTDSKEKTDDNFGYKFDSGDDSSFADNGFSLEKNIEKYTSAESTLNVIYYNYFLPPNFNPDIASLMCEQLKSPLAYYARIQKKYIPSPPSAVNQNDCFSPKKFSLEQNYPNPFNSETMISFALPKKERVALRIYDTLGRLIYTVVDQTLPEGSHKFGWNGHNDEGQPVPSGLYFYKLKAGEFNSTRKLLLIK